MKTLQLAAAALAVGVLAFPAKAASTTTNDWWNVDFESPTPGGVSLEVGSLGPLTNNGQSATAPYTNGLWSASAEDESFITNSFNSVTTNGYQFGYNPCLKLDTQGNDLTWTPDPNAVAKLEGVKTLVDADLYLVGSDSEPTEFDGGDVQTAIYLKNELYDDQALEHAGDVSNSVLCVYVYDSIAKKNYWQELEGVALSNEAWAHVQVIVDHTSADPVVQVYVNQIRMHKRDGDPSDVDYEQWSLANLKDSSSAGLVSSVAFRGTGAVDNFVGKTLETSVDRAFFTAEAYLDNDTLLDELCQVTPDQIDIGREPAVFSGIPWAAIDWDKQQFVYVLDKVEIIDYVNNGVRTYQFEFDPDNPDGEFISPTPSEGEVRFSREEGELKVDFSVYATTDGAPGPVAPGEIATNLIAKVYFKTAYAHDAIAETVIGGNTTTNSIVVKAEDFEGGSSKTVSWEFPAVDGGNVLSTIQVYNGAELSYANRKATVTKTLSTELDADTLFVTATYAAGSLADGKDLDPGDPVNGLYTFSEYTPPVAMVVSADGTTTNDTYTTLASAVAAVQEGETVYLLATVAEGIHYEGEAAFTIDLNGQTWNYVFDDNYAAFKNDGATVTFKDSVGTGKIEVAPNPNKATDEADGFCFWSRTGSIVIESGSYVNDSDCDYAVYLGTYDRNFKNGEPPTITITGGTFTNKNTDPYAHNNALGHSLNLNVVNYDSTHQLARTTLIQVSGGTFTYDPSLGDDVMGGSFVAPGYKSVAGDGVWTVKAYAVQIEGVDGAAWLSIADAQAAAPTYGVDDPVFVIVAPLSAETVTLATVDDTLTVKTEDWGYLANLTVETSVASTEAVEYQVEPRTTGMGLPITVFYEVVPTYYVAKIVDGETTTKYETFEEAATAAAAENATLVVEMVASTNAVEIYGLPADYVLMVKKNGFLVPAVDSASRGHYVDESPADETGVTTYSSQPYLTATFLNGDGSQIVELLVKAGQTPPLTKDQDDEVEPYPAAQPGYVINHHLFSWSPALGPIYTNTTFHPLFTTNVTQYSIQYTLDGGAWPAGYTPPEWYAVTNATIELPSPVKDGWTFNGWYTNKTDGAYVGDLMNPGVIPTGSYGPKFFYAAWEENSVEPPKVDVGQGLAAYNAAHPDAPVEPIAFAIPEGGQTELCHLSFVAPEDGWYFLYTSTTVAGQYLPDYTTKKQVSKDELVTLVESEAGTTKFFKIGWSETDPSAN